MMKPTIHIDGSQGEGGGQVLRSALTLAMVTGQPFTIEQIRAKRKTPGLMRQHLTAVQAATTVCAADTQGAVLGATTLSFTPGPLSGGDYTFAIATAGSCTLVAQTLVPALFFAPVASTLRLTGGTHNPMAPPATFLQRAYLPQLRAMGATVDLAIERHGFFPAGGGRLLINVAPLAAEGARAFPGQCGRPLLLTQRGDRVQFAAEALLAGLDQHIGERELDRLAEKLNWPRHKQQVVRLPEQEGPGNVLMATLAYRHVTEVYTAFGERGKTAETVASGLADALKPYLGSTAAVGEHLADQLLLPMALCAGGEFTCTHVSDHLKTNAAVIQQFLPVRIQFEPEGRCLVRVRVQV